MKTILISFLSVQIPVLDWSGPRFLMFYALMYAVAVAWAVIWKRQAYEKFSVPRGKTGSLGDPYEAGYLAGGGDRCAQLAVVRLLQQGSVAMKTPMLGKSKLMAIGEPTPAMHDVERTLFDEIARRGKSGLPLNQVLMHIWPRLAGIEVRLATMGLRPTRSERANSMAGILVPFVLLMVLGGVKLLIGLGRGKPVAFLAILLLVVFVTACVILTRRKRLTRAGEDTLAAMREKHKREAGSAVPDPGLMSMSVALMGVGALAGFGEVWAADAAMEKEISKMSGTPPGDSGGSGCGSSGCSSSGGGGCGGGCGGCGGGD